MPGIAEAFPAAVSVQYFFRWRIALQNKPCAYADLCFGAVLGLIPNERGYRISTRYGAMSTVS